MKATRRKLIQWGPIHTELVAQQGLFRRLVEMLYGKNEVLRVLEGRQPPLPDDFFVTPDSTGFTVTPTWRP